jgi:tRNA threonylcarbamoyladenosine biosynthesis protein TsaB
LEKDMIILSADTSSSRFSLALYCNDKAIDGFKSAQDNRQSSDMLPEIDNLLVKNSLRPRDIGLFCIGIGPGSFTGLRIGITIMRTMAIVLKKPIAGVPSLDTIACGLAPCQGRICVIVDAKQKKVYARFYKQRKGQIVPVSRIMLLNIKELMRFVKGPVLFAGDGINSYRNNIIEETAHNVSFSPEDKWYPDARAIAGLGRRISRPLVSQDILTLSPLYIYKKQC